MITKGWSSLLDYLDENTFIVVEEKNQCKSHASSWHKIVSESYNEAIYNSDGNKLNNNINIW